MRAVSQEFALLVPLIAVMAHAANLPPMELAGDAAISGKALRLTPARVRMVGAAWLADKQQISTGFETSFEFRLTHQGGGGADGFAFVLQNSGPHAIAGRGSAGGFAMGDGHGDPLSPAIPSSIAIFFDTYQNLDSGDPSGNYIAVCSTGRPENMRWPPSRLAVAPRLPVKMKDRKTHSARIVFRPPILSVFLDRAEVLSAPVDLSLVADAAGEAYAGFTASTGDGFQNHDILTWSFTAGPPKADVSSKISFAEFACLPDRNLCTPDRAAVTETGEGTYHVILPANLEWGASIAGENAAITNARGTICWDATHCNGPDGNGILAGDGFLAPDRPPGALVVRTKDGRIDFSVNGRNAADNQGYFEFDVERKP
ncbi:MAG TPA: L-type lectin-domain containing protein [Bryobacteraceae bacterium]|nr:L-type lectin-domain containing protein [Bryobacteraceae bacterium]